MPSAKADGHEATTSAFCLRLLRAQAAASICPIRPSLISRFLRGYSGSGFGSECSPIFIALHFTPDYAFTFRGVAPFCTREDLAHPQSPNGTTCNSKGCNEMKLARSGSGSSGNYSPKRRSLSLSKGAHAEVSVVPEWGSVSKESVLKKAFQNFELLTRSRSIRNVG
ncbi:MAG: hypothetical protein JNK09_02920 [Prolixibacteraceae bacterium]|nr:hypothetical protein [Prolixibacteraceae bacterium]